MQAMPRSKKEAQGVAGELAPDPRLRHDGDWETLDRTSPSGCTLFKCKICGRESKCPDKECYTFEMMDNEKRDLVMLVKRLANALRKTRPELAKSAVDYLRRAKLISPLDILRAKP